jgi:hypothetical protein
MNVAEWSQSTVGYGRKLVHSTIGGVHDGECSFLEQGRLTPYFAEVTKKSLIPAALGAALGACCGYLANRRRSAATALAGGILGGTIGFSAGTIWESRELTVSVGSSVRKRVQQTRDEHWFEKHPIDYA